MVWKKEIGRYAITMNERIYSNWQDSAKCIKEDPEIFFVGDTRTTETENVATRDAKKACGACAVQSTCLENALANGEKFGIWGGLRTSERSALKRRRHF